MGRLTVLQTSPRVPAGLLSAAAWQALLAADEVLTADPGSALPAAVRAAGVAVTSAERATADELLTRAENHIVVWLSGDDPAKDLAGALATAVVRRSETAAIGPELEILVGSYDPPGARLLDLVTVMDRLRRGCPWDREQTHRSLVRYLVEETYETVEAIESGDPEHLREELGDLLLQVVFHARMAEEHDAEPFDIDDVAAGIVEKLVLRHPHVFAPESVTGRDTAAAVQASWETIKATEKARTSAMDGIPPALPALSLADKVLSRARRAGLAGEPTAGAAALEAPLAVDQADETAAAVGEALFAVVAAAQVSGVDAEQALRDRVRAEMDRVRSAEQRALPGGTGPLG